jgi:hypothetical protein
VFFPQKKEVTFHFLFYLFINDVHRHSDNGRVGQHCHPERNAVKPKDPTNGVLNRPMGSFDVAQDDTKKTLRMTGCVGQDDKGVLVIPTLHKNHYYSQNKAYNSA